LTIGELGSLGELIAAVATVATLAYLALQIRQNSKSIEGSTIQSLLDMEVATFKLLAQHPNVYRRGCANISDLNEDEKVVFVQLVASEISVMVTAFSQFQNGLILNYDAYLAEWKQNYLKLSGFQSVWAEIRRGYPDDFCQYLDKISKDADGSA
jgi:hypothetical protein